MRINQKHSSSRLITGLFVTVCTVVFLTSDKAWADELSRMPRPVCSDMMSERRDTADMRHAYYHEMKVHDYLVESRLDVKEALDDGCQAMKMSEEWESAMKAKGVEYDKSSLTRHRQEIRHNMLSMKAPLSKIRVWLDSHDTPVNRRFQLNEKKQKLRSHINKIKEHIALAKNVMARYSTRSE